MEFCSFCPMSESEGGPRFLDPTSKDVAWSVSVTKAILIVSNIVRRSLCRPSNDVFKTTKSCGESKASTMSSNKGTVA